MRAALAAACVLAGVVCPPAQAEPLPLWELGAGAFGFSLPDYRGSDERRGYLYPLPYFVYRGPALRVDRQGVRGIFFESDRVQLDLSVYGTPPVDSSRNQARQGMPDLDGTVEVGPLLTVTMLRDRGSGTQIDLRLPVRAVLATNFEHLHPAGYVFNPTLALNLRPQFAQGRWNLGLSTGPIFASQKYHQYYYGVDEQFATPERSAYSARGGYSGWMALASLSRRYEKIWVGGFVRYDSLSDAVFDDSPLLRRKSSLMAGLGIAWIFSQSERRVEVSEPYY